MIIDKTDNWNHYYFGPAWKLAFDFLQSLTTKSDEKKYNIQGDDIFATVMSYKTRTIENAVIESHRKYVDIQAIITGSESIECFSRNGLTVDKIYDESKDAEFYKYLCPGFIKVALYPGTFIALFPHDAHMPSLAINEKPEDVLKVVVKVKTKLLTLQYL